MSISLSKIKNGLIFPICKLKTIRYRNSHERRKETLRSKEKLNYTNREIYDKLGIY